MQVLNREIRCKNVVEIRLCKCSVHWCYWLRIWVVRVYCRVILLAKISGFIYFHLPKKKFGEKIINIICIYLLAHFIVQNFKKILPVDPELMRISQFWAQNGPFPQMRFFQETCEWVVFFIHAYLHAKNESQILIYDWNIDN